MGVAGIPDWEPQEPHAAKKSLWKNPRFHSLLAALAMIGLFAGLFYAATHAQEILDWLYR